MASIGNNVPDQFQPFTANVDGPNFHLVNIEVSGWDRLESPFDYHDNGLCYGLEQPVRWQVSCIVP
jgi:hypothetical protein